MSRSVGCVVEGHGDVPAARQLVTRLAAEEGFYELLIFPPHRVPRNQLVAPGPLTGRDLGRVLDLQAGRVGQEGLVVVLVDADDDDPATVKSVIREAGMQHDCWILPVVATREYEAWFLAALESLRSHPAVRDDASYAGDPEMPRGAKAALARQMTTSYKETIHQPAFTAAMDLAQAAGADQFGSFRAAYRAWLHGTGHPELVPPPAFGG